MATAFNQGIASIIVEQKQNAELDRERLMKRALDNYNGVYEPPFRTKLGEPDDNVMANYARVIVDKGVSFLFGNPLGIAVGEASGTQASRLPPRQGTASGTLALQAMAYLDQVWPPEQREVDLIDLATNGGVCGTAWLKIKLNNGAPKIVILDPLNVTADWDGDDYTTALSFTNQYITVDAAGRPVVKREQTIRRDGGWVIQTSQSVNGGPWQATGPDVVWNYDFPPVFFCKNLPAACEFYGRADLSRDVLKSIYAVQRIDSILNRILRLHAYPKVIGKGMKPQDLQVGADGTLFLSDLEQEIKILEMQSDLAATQNFRLLLREVIAELTHVPSISTSALDKVGQLSGLALQILYGPLTDRTKIKRLLYGMLLQQTCSALLELGGIAVDAAITLHWPEMLPGDPKAEAETYLLHEQLGVSKDTILRKLGYDPAQERQNSGNP